MSNENRNKLPNPDSQPLTDADLTEMHNFLISNGMVAVSTENGEVQYRMKSRLEYNDNVAEINTLNEVNSRLMQEIQFGFQIRQQIIDSNKLLDVASINSLSQENLTDFNNKLQILTQGNLNKIELLKKNLQRSDELLKKVISFNQPRVSNSQSANSGLHSGVGLGLHASSNNPQSPRNHDRTNSTNNASSASTTTASSTLNITPNGP
jgi:hypothetical protein